MADMIPAHLLNQAISVWRFLPPREDGSTAPRFSTIPETAPARVERKSRRVTTADGVEVVSTHTVSTNLEVRPMDRVSTSIDTQIRQPLDVIRTETPDGRGYTRVLL